MSVNLLLCTASSWRGAHDRCRWCDQRAPGMSRSRRFCSRRCITAYADNHLYARAKYVVLEASRRECGCPPGRTITKRWYDPSSEQVRFDQIPPPHRHCSSCGRCEAALHAAGDRLTVNHIEPRLGIECSTLNCIHHLDNLEPLCWSEHEALNIVLNARLARERQVL